MKKKLVIVGTSHFAQIAHEYFTHDSDYDVVAFSVESNYIQEPELFGKPVVAFEHLTNVIPKDHFIFVAISYHNLNNTRKRLHESARKMGYPIASYISSKAFVWHNAIVGENTFVFENNTIQPFVTIGHNVVLWSGNHIGHHSLIEDHVYIASHVVISGGCRIGEQSFIGVNASFADKVTVGKRNVITMGSVLTKSTKNDEVYRGNPAKCLKISSERMVQILNK